VTIHSDYRDAFLAEQRRFARAGRPIFIAAVTMDREIRSILERLGRFMCNQTSICHR
jgi:hypothetical protein